MFTRRILAVGRTPPCAGTNLPPRHNSAKSSRSPGGQRRSPNRGPVLNNGTPGLGHGSQAVCRYGVNQLALSWPGPAVTTIRGSATALKILCGVLDQDPALIAHFFAEVVRIGGCAAMSVKPCPLGLKPQSCLQLPEWFPSQRDWGHPPDNPSFHAAPIGNHSALRLSRVTILFRNSMEMRFYKCRQSRGSKEEVTPRLSAGRPASVGGAAARPDQAVTVVDFDQ